MEIFRRKTKKIKVGNLYIGGDSEISIQGMTKVSSSNIPLLLQQVKKMIEAGAELIRISILKEEDTNSIPILKEKFSIPIVTDIHYNYKFAISSIHKGADKIRINPGNIKKQDLKKIIYEANKTNTPIRIGINSGSIKIKNSIVKSMIQNAMDTIKFFQDNDFHSIIISLKTPFVRETIESYREMAEMCDYPFHLGITEAGTGYLGESKSIVGIGSLLLHGIGDTIRVSLTDSPIKEILIARTILQSLNLRKFEPEIISCPTCGRIQVDLKKIVKEAKEKISKLVKEYPDIKNMKIAIMGCSVNGPGEAKNCDIGIAGGKRKFALFKKGKIIGVYPENKIIKKLIEKIIERRKNGNNL